MALEQRIPLYRKIEETRGRPLLVYVTSARSGAGGQLASDAVGEFLAQLQALPDENEGLDLLIVSNGGDPTVAWRIVSLIRERAGEFSVLVPHAAFSAATLIALGADEIVMHPHGNLGPVDPQIQVQPRVDDGKQGGKQVTFGSEDLSAFLRYCKEEVGLVHEEQLVEAFRLFCSEVGAVVIGVAARSAQLSVTMGEKLLRLHMKKPEEEKEVKTIVETLNKQFFHHGYPVSRSEAAHIGLKIADRDKAIEDLMWRVWSDLEEELEIRTPFNPMQLLAGHPGSKDLFSAVPQVQLPANLPPAVQQQAIQQALQQVQVVGIEPAPFEVIHAVLESSRAASRFCSSGRVYGVRQPDLQIKVNMVQESAAWKSMPVDRGGDDEAMAGGDEAPQANDPEDPR